MIRLSSKKQTLRFHYRTDHHFFLSLQNWLIHSNVDPRGDRKLTETHILQVRSDFRLTLVKCVFFSVPRSNLFFRQRWNDRMSSLGLRDMN